MKAITKKKNQKTNTNITEGQKKQFFRFVEDATEQVLKEMNLNKDEIQKLIKNGGKFQSRIKAVIWELSTGNQCADEKAESNTIRPRGSRRRYHDPNPTGTILGQRRSLNQSRRKL